QEPVVALTGTLADAGEHGGTRELACDTSNHFLNENGLTNTRTTEEANLAALNVRGQQVGDLNTGFEDFSLALELVECWWFAVDSPLLTIATQAWLVQPVAQCVTDVALTPSPTGTEIGVWGAVAAAPRTRPSVGAMDTARTRLSPRCCATSRVMVRATASSSISTVSALYSSGSPPRGNSTSTTGPMTRTTRPATAESCVFCSCRAVVII